MDALRKMKFHDVTVLKKQQSGLKLKAYYVLYEIKKKSNAIGSKSFEI